MGSKNGGTSKAVYAVRILIGAYLLYIDYQIFNDVMAREGISRIVMLAIMALFLIAGIILIVFSLKALMGVGKQDKKEDGEDADDDGEKFTKI